MRSMARGVRDALGYVRYLAQPGKKRVRNACVPVAHHKGFRVLYELEKTVICKHSFSSVPLRRKPKNNRTKVRTDMHDDHTVIWYAASPEHRRAGRFFL
ncbi:hypothetical protein [Pseudoduganella lutea]|uniref:Uncharacterized protein n=1 Tax=Pseudoduganella lutea TaxID=321985 RepID=A0A4P6KZU0_9BURK|nr:hypothetical protein [Pseudoduganella lutea]QBE64454.1 hypothetical protein EWM63_16885 [Pseudoduganella lutea]